MALKAGLVGVNPNGVDKNGMPKTDNTELNKIAGNLTANDKDFVFAYDETTEKYGYKAGADGDFVPFNSGGGGAGWVKPSDLITTGLTFGNYVDYEEGGYKIGDGVVYFDMVILKKSNSTGIDIPNDIKPSSSYNLNVVKNTVKNQVVDNYFMASAINAAIESRITLGSGVGSANDYLHIFGQYPITTT